jgi:glycosyltransferase involved in cell wall biosynthesis
MQEGLSADIYAIIASPAGVKLDAIASEGHFVDHLLPVWLALPEEARGTFYLPDGRPSVLNAVRGHAPASKIPTLVASSGDLYRSHRLGRPSAIMEHGCGQSFGGDRKSANHTSYAGGGSRDAQLFLHPGPHPAVRDRERYPSARVEIVGCPKLDTLPRKERNGAPVAAVGFHWDCRISEETRSAAPTFMHSVHALARSGIKLLGHGHPRIIGTLARYYQRYGIEVVLSFAEVCARADVYLNDASSTLFEFASTGRPVIVLNPPIYRRSVNHGLRFWEAATVGVQVTPKDDLADAITQALADPPEQRAAREAALDLVYAYRTGGAERAVAALVDWAA